MFRSTGNSAIIGSILQTTLQPVPEPGCLWVPVQLEAFDADWFSRLHDRPWIDTAVDVLFRLTAAQIPRDLLREIVPTLPSAPLAKLEDDKYILELFHGPTNAFKDFGAIFMARATSYLLQTEEGKQGCYRPRVLVATSGDTGGAVANAFAGTTTPVCVLFPKGRISEFQKSQICRCGPGVCPIQVDGSFDDCQRIVKEGLNQKGTLSANSINLLRLVAQSLYYFDAIKQLGPISALKKPVVVCVPSGNMGNGTACLLAMRLGLPIDQLILATNSNDSVPRMLASGSWEPQKTVATISSAMDVGNPSNFARLWSMAGGSVDGLRDNFHSDRATDDEAFDAMRKVHQKYHYVADPHTSVGLAVLGKWTEKHGEQGTSIVLSTAHPYKFEDIVSSGLGGLKVAPPDNVAPWKYEDATLHLVGSDAGFVKLITASMVCLGGSNEEHRRAIAQALKDRFHYDITDADNSLDELLQQATTRSSSSVVVLNDTVTSDPSALVKLSQVAAVVVIRDNATEPLALNDGTFLHVTTSVSPEAVAWSVAAILPPL